MKLNFFQKIFLLNFVILFFCLSVYGQQNFGMEKQMSYSLSPSIAIWNVLKNYANDFSCGTPEKRWFQISKININKDKIPDLIAYPKEVCIQGSNITTFFIFKGIGKNKFKLVLKTGAFSISILNTKHRYKNIKAYSFVGQRIMIISYALRANNYQKFSEVYEESEP
jgi:hypothetical protein